MGRAGAGVAPAAAGVARGGTATAVEAVVRAQEAVVKLPKLMDIITGMGERAAKLSSYLDPGRYFRIEDTGGLPIVRTNDLHLLIDAVRRQRGQIDQAAGAMSTAIRGKWNELKTPFQVKDGIIQDGPAAGNAFLDVMSWSPEDSHALLTPQQAAFSDYFHRLQDDFVRMIEAGGTRINKITLPDGRRYIHEVFTMVDDYRNQIGAKVGTGVKQTFEFRRSHTEEDAVLNLLRQGKVETLDDPASIFFMYAQEVLKKAADSDFTNLIKPLGVSVRERLGQPVIDAAISAAQMKRGAEHLVRVAKQVVSGASPAGATLRVLRQNFPQIGNQLDQALAIKTPNVDSIISNIGKEMWDNLATTPARFREALNQVTLSTATRIPKQVSYSDIMDTLGLLRADQKTADEMITQIYRNAFQFNKAQRGAALKDVLIAAQDELASASQLAKSTKSQYTNALNRAADVRPGEGRLNIPGLRQAGPAGEATFKGKRAQVLAEVIFPSMNDGGVTIGNTTMDGADFAAQIRKALGAQGEQRGEAWLKLLTMPNAVIKTGQVLFDLSGPLIQGFPVLMSNPKLWGKAAALSYKTFVAPETRTNWLARPENYRAMKEFVEAGGKLGTSDWMEALEAGGGLAGLTQKLAKPMGKVPGAAFLGEHINPAESFTAFSDLVRVMTYDSLKDVATTPGVASEVADFASKLTGGRGMYGPIYSPVGRGLGQLAVYAMDYTKASLSLAADAFKPGVGGDLSRHALGRMAGAYPAVMYAAALGVDAAAGESRYSNPDHEDFVFNPDGRYFMRIPIGGDVINYAGIWPALVRTTAKSTWEAAKGHPEKFAQAWTDFATSRMGPLLGLGRTQISGQTFRGEPLTREDKLEEIGVRALELAKSTVPLTAQAALEGQEAPSLIMQFGGAGTARKTLSAQRDELLDRYAKEAGGGSWDALALDEQRALRKKYPDIIQAQDVARARQAATGRGEWKTYARFNQLVAGEREKIKADITDLTAQFKARDISGQQYRDEIQKREFEIGRLSARFQGQAEFKNMPVTPEEYTAFEQRMELKPAVKTPERTAVDAGIEGYYAIGREWADESGFIKDMSGFMRAREKFMAGLPENVRSRVDTYVNENKDPELVEAQKIMAERQRIPRYRMGLSPEEEDAIVQAEKKIEARAGLLPPFVPNRQTFAFFQEMEAAKTPEERRVLEQAFIIMKKPKLRNTIERGMFWAQHPLLQKYYSDVVLD